MDLSRDFAAWAWLGLALLGCGAARAPESLGGRLPGTDGRSHEIVDASANFTLIEFFSAHCPCQAQHDARLLALAERYQGRGVAFVVIDSELDATLTRDATEAQRRGYPYPILVDPTGSAARQLKAEYATYSLLIARGGQVLFRGGIDSDRSHLRDDRARYLQDAIDDALAEMPVRKARADTLGCALMLNSH